MSLLLLILISCNTGGHSNIYPALAYIARDLLAAPASTVASESAFSTGERVISDYRSRLTSETIEALICLQDWIRAEGFKLEWTAAAPQISDR